MGEHYTYLIIAVIKIYLSTHTVSVSVTCEWHCCHYSMLCELCLVCVVLVTKRGQIVRNHLDKQNNCLTRQPHMWSSILTHYMKSWTERIEAKANETINWIIYDCLFFSFSSKTDFISKNKFNTFQILFLFFCNIRKIYTLFNSKSIIIIVVV